MVGGLVRSWMRRFIVSFGWRYGGSSTDYAVQIRLLVDGNEVTSDYHTPSMTASLGAYKMKNYHGVFTPPAGVNSYSIEVQVRVENASQTVTVRDLALSVVQE